jgi:hypothetical protein
VIQVPIAALATAGNIAVGDLDIRLGALLAVALVAGAVLGARAAHVVSSAFLTRLVGILMLAVGGLIVLRQAGVL